MDGTDPKHGSTPDTASKDALTRSELVKATRSNVLLPNDRQMADRRAVLRLGMAGLPMMVTLKASANSSYVSQLQCIMTIPSGYSAMIDVNGRVWLAVTNWSSVPPITEEVVNDFKSSAVFVFPDGTAPSTYIPDGQCDPNTGADPGTGPQPCDDDDDDNDDDDEDDSGGGSGGGSSDDDDDIDYNDPQYYTEKCPRWERWGKKKQNRRREECFTEPSQNSGGYGGGGSNDDDSDDDDDDCGGDNGPATYSCAYTIVNFPDNDQFHMGDVVSEGGQWSATGLRAFWIELATAYTREFPNGATFPGVSCLVSVLNFLNQS